MTTDKQATLERSSDEAPIRAQMVIGGESLDAADGQTFDVVNPATGKVIATAPAPVTPLTIMLTTLLCISPPYCGCGWQITTAAAGPLPCG